MRGKSWLPGIRIECDSESGADALGELAVGIVNLEEIARGSGDSVGKGYKVQSTRVFGRGILDPYDAA